MRDLGNSARLFQRKPGFKASITDSQNFALSSEASCS